MRKSVYLTILIIITMAVAVLVFWIIRKSNNGPLSSNVTESPIIVNYKKSVDTTKSNTVYRDGLGNELFYDLNSATFYLFLNAAESDKDYLDKQQNAEERVMDELGITLDEYCYALPLKILGLNQLEMERILCREYN